MNTLEKEFLPYEQALELKELGFDEPCLTSYNKNGKIFKVWENEIVMGITKCSAPLYSQAINFLYIYSNKQIDIELKELEKLIKDVKICGIYKITSPTDRVYIGQSNDIRRRILTYFEPKGGSSQVRLKASFNKYGIDLHNFIILEECEESLLNERERYWQEHYNVLSKSGLNCKMTTTLDKSGILSDKTKKLIGSKTKGTTKTCQSTMKKVYQYAKDGTFLQEYVSLREAERQTGVFATSISSSIKNRRYSKSAGGYLWSYDKLQSHYGNVGPVGKIIQQFTLDDTFIQEFESICSAAKQLNISKSGIIRCCKGKQKQCGGFTFKYITNENI